MGHFSWPRKGLSMSRGILMDFNALPRSTRQRLIAGTQPGHPHSALFEAPERSSSSIAIWVLIGLCCLGVLALLVPSDFGGNEPFSRPLQAPEFLALYAPAAFLLAAAILGIAFHLKLETTGGKGGISSRRA